MHEKISTRKFALRVIKNVLYKREVTENTKRPKILSQVFFLLQKFFFLLGFPPRGRKIAQKQ